MLGFVSNVNGDEFSISCEVSAIRWSELSEAPGLLRPGSIGQQHLKRVIEHLDARGSPQR